MRTQDGDCIETSIQTGARVHFGMFIIIMKQFFRRVSFGVPIDADHHKINVRLVFDVKASGKQKGRLVARGDLTPEPDEAVYSSVASLRSLRTIIFLSELNNLHLWQGDIGNAYLESYTQEKVYFIAGPEFGPLQGHTMKIIKALYGLRVAG